MTTKFLSGIRVLDFGQFIAGPYCANLLGGFGAEVIRVERFSGASDRTVLSFNMDEQGDGALYSCMNTNKKSVAIDLLSPQGQAISSKLITTADIVVANMPVSLLQSLKLDHASIKGINDKTILVTCSAYGGTPEKKDLLGFDGIGQALSGAMHMTGNAGEARKSFVHYVDYFTATLSAFGAVMALRERENGGPAHRVESSLLGSALAMMNGTLIEEATRHINRQGTGNLGQSAAPANVYATKDGSIILQVIGASMFRRWANLIGHPEWPQDPRFENDSLRGENRTPIDAAARAWCLQYTNAEALKKLQAAQLPASPVLSPRQTLADADIIKGNFLRDGLDPSGEHTIPVNRLPLEISGAHLEESRRAPQLGEDTRAVMIELGYSDSELEKLIDSKVIFCS